MNDSDQLSKDAFKYIDSVLKQLTRRWASIKKAKQDLDLKTVAQALEGIDEDIRQLENSWSEHHTVIEEAIRVDREFVLSDAYPLEVEKAMRDAEIPMRGEFPIGNYQTYGRH